MNAIPEQEVVTYLKNNLKEWTFEKKAISRNFTFKTFVEAFSFMTAIALEAE
jgi:4a-hydroxytetrahydrobiopterin dehydratase